MPRFPAAFSRRKSSVENVDHGTTGSSFRVMDRAEVAGAPKSPDPDHLTVRRPVKSRTLPGNLASEAALVEDNIFADLKNIRGSGSGSSNTTKTASTDNSSRHSNASTAPSSTDLNAHNHQQQQHHPEDWRHSSGSNAYNGSPVPSIPKSASSSFLKSAGRTFSFGGPKKAQSASPAQEDRSPVSTPPDRSGRDRAATSSTTSTATPPKLQEDFNLDMGGDFTKMLDGGFDKKASAQTARDDGPGRAALAPRSLTANRHNQPVPIQLDHVAKVDPSPYSWSSHHSNDQLLQSASARASPTNGNAPPVPRHTMLPSNRSEKTAPSNPIPVSGSAPALPSSSDASLKRTSTIFRRRSAMEYVPEPEDEEDVLLQDSFSAVSKFLNEAASSSSSVLAKSSATVASRFIGTGYRQVPNGSTSPFELATQNEEDNMFDTPLSPVNKMAMRSEGNLPSQAQTKVMTPEQFERYRKDKERENRRSTILMKTEDGKKVEDEDNYDEDEYEDEAEKMKQAAKQRRKQEAHMTVYRQQMMKVTGESASGTLSRPGLPTSPSSPNLPTGLASTLGVSMLSPQAGSDISDDEEVPLAILAAHGFPNKNRPPVRLTAMMSNPNLRAAAAASYQRPGSAAGEAQNGGGGGGRLPAFARNLPQDPYGLVNPPVRETLQFGGGAPAPTPQPGSPLPPHGGLVGVIASEERSRALRRGNVDGVSKPMPNMMTGAPFDPVAGMQQHATYLGMGQQPQVLSPGDQAQIQMTQQMQQFMQMQMQFMQMMATGGGNAMPQRPESPYSNTSGMNAMMGGAGMGMGGPDMMRPSFMDNGPMVDGPGQYTDGHMRSMSMVQPSSASWIQPLQIGSGVTPSIRLQGTNGYAPSIAPSERSNIGMPGRYRPVSHMPSASMSSDMRKPMTMSGALSAGVADALASEGTIPGTASPGGWDQSRKQTNRSPLNNSENANGEDDDDEMGWAEMQAKREQKLSMWKLKKTLGNDIGALIT